MSYFISPRLFVILSILITSVGKERAVFLLLITHILLFLFEGVPLPMGAWERLHYFIVALPGPCI